MKIRIALVVACLAMMAQAKTYHYGLDERTATVRLAPNDCALPGVPLGWRAAELVAPHMPPKAGCWHFNPDTGVVSVLWADGSTLRLPVLRVRE